MLLLHPVNRVVCVGLKNNLPLEMRMIQLIPRVDTPPTSRRLLDDPVGRGRVGRQRVTLRGQPV